MNNQPQQINLYNPAYRLPFDAFSFRSAARIVGGALLLGAAVVGVMLGETSLKSREIESIESGSQARTERLAKKIPEQLARRARAQEQTRKLVAEETMYRGILDAAGAVEGGNRRTYGEMLVALSKSTVDGLWLTRIELSERADSMTLHGRMLDANALPSYLSRLNAMGELSGLRFEQIELAADKQADWLDFTLRGAASEAGRESVLDEARRNIKGNAP